MNSCPEPAVVNEYVTEFVKSLEVTPLCWVIGLPFTITVAVAPLESVNVGIKSVTSVPEGTFKLIVPSI